MISPSRPERKDGPWELLRYTYVCNSPVSVKVVVEATELDGGVPDWVVGGLSIVGGTIGAALTAPAGGVAAAPTPAPIAAVTPVGADKSSA